MAAPVFSERLLATAAKNGWTRWTVPAGYRAVIRCVTSMSGNSSQQYVEVAAATMYLFFFDFQAPTSQIAGDLRVVCYAGELIEVNHVGEALWTTISGYLFDDALGSRVLEAPEQLPAHPDLPPIEHPGA